MRNFADLALDCFQAAIRRVAPARLIADQVQLLARDQVQIGPLKLNRQDVKRLSVVGAGKASAAMAAALEEQLKGWPLQGMVVVKYGHTQTLQTITVLEAGHPVSDQAGALASAQLMAQAEAAQEQEVVLGLFSGGGSALLTDCPPSFSWEELAQTNALLVQCGAPIAAINTVRKHLSQLKGGQLARRIFPAISCNLILSDVVGDPLEVIASGPTVADATTFTDALAVLDAYDLRSRLPRSIVAHLLAGQAGQLPETIKPGDPYLARTYNTIIGNNALAVAAAAATAQAAGLNTIIADQPLQGDTSAALAHILAMIQPRRPTPGPHCFVFGGETTVTVDGPGLGGRNQHLALQAAIALTDWPGEIVFMAAGTDGSDGPTDATGAWVTQRTARQAQAQGLDPQAYLQRCDAYTFFAKTAGQIKTGPTLTNVMDLVIVMIK